MTIVKKHWVGFHEVGQMNNPGYLDTWVNMVKKEEEDNNEVLVFSIPKGIGLIEKLEAFIQDEVENYQLSH